MYAAYLHLLTAALRDDPAIRRRDAEEATEQFSFDLPVSTEPRETRTEPMLEVRLVKPLPSNC